MDRYRSIASVSISGVQGNLQTSPWGHSFPSGNLWPAFVNGGDPVRVAQGAQMSQDSCHLRKEASPNRVLSNAC